jgi:O-acetyl-ADP-ribose deacetylase (regulator of RNase III)
MAQWLRPDAAKSPHLRSLPHGMAIEVIQGDITRLAVDAIVNAANESLSGGGGVDGAIHRAAGPGLARECLALPFVRPGVRCPSGEARMTLGHELAAHYVIHTVGPIWRGGHHGEAGLLASCYRSSLQLAAAHGVESIAFPAISCGIYGYPPEQAAPIAIANIQTWLQAQSRPRPRHILLCCFDALMAGIYHRALQASAV